MTTTVVAQVSEAVPTGRRGFAALLPSRSPKLIVGLVLARLGAAVEHREIVGEAERHIGIDGEALRAVAPGAEFAEIFCKVKELGTDLAILPRAGGIFDVDPIG